MLSGKDPKLTSTPLNGVAVIIQTPRGGLKLLRRKLFETWTGWFGKNLMVEPHQLVMGPIVGKRHKHTHLRKD